MENYQNYYVITGEQRSWVWYTTIHGAKVVLLAFFFYNAFSEFCGELTILRAICITLASSNMFGWFFICHALMSKNIYQMKIFNYILTLELILLITLVMEALGRIHHVGALAIFPIAIIIGLEMIYNCLVIKAAAPEFSWYYFKKTRMSPNLLGKSIF
ncbi:putative transporter [Trachipleistophora hominis]|uniref:Putative transporter n=1 Tax=Trachipleistophora hominis TaxID=72359 RepID=L7JWP3_TRAHO|nr:putative transporter [Trachipleistophora hominis]